MTVLLILAAAGICGLALGCMFERFGWHDWHFVVALMGLIASLNSGAVELNAPMGFWLWTGALLLLCSATAWIDWKSRGIMDGLSLALAVTGLAHVMLMGGPWLWFLAGAAAAFGLLFLLTRISTAGITVLGAGDPGLMAGLALWLGPVGTIAAIVWSAWILAIVLLVQLVLGRHSDVPLAPVLCAVAILIWVRGPLIIAL